MTATYITTDDINQFMNMKSEVPDITIVGSDRPLEVVSTATATTNRLYLDNSCVIADSYTFYYGTTEALALASSLTETTHYTLDKEKSIFVLTSAGATLVGTNNIYAEYAYNNLGLKDSYIQDVADKAQQQFDTSTATHFANGTDATPDYTQITNEIHTGKGKYNRDYYTVNYPLPDVNTSVGATASIGATTITLTSTNGFLSSGIIGIDSNKIIYTGKTATALTGVTGVTTQIIPGASAIPYVIETSITDDGTLPVWVIQSKDDDYSLDLDTGQIHLSNGSYPSNSVPNRVRVSYIYGHDTIPEDVKKATLMIASKDILHMAVRRAHTDGSNDFNPAMINVDEDDIQNIINKYMNIYTDNT